MGLEHILTCLLILCAGLINAVGFMIYARSMGNVTGLSTSIMNKSFTGEDNKLLGIQIAQLVAYGFGGVLSGALINNRTTIRFGVHLYGVVLLFCSVCTFLGWLLIRHDRDSEHGGWGQMLLVLSLGAQNGMFSKHFSAVVRTTHVTGTVTDIGVLLGHMVARSFVRVFGKTEALGPEEEAERQQLIHNEHNQLTILSALMMSFLLGNLIGFALYKKEKENALLFPVALYFVLGIWQLVYLKRAIDGAARRDVYEEVKQQVVAVKKKLESPRGARPKAGGEGGAPPSPLALGGGGDKVRVGDMEMQKPPLPPPVLSLGEAHRESWMSFGSYPSTPPRTGAGGGRRKTAL